MKPERYEVWLCRKHGVCPDDSEFVEGQDPDQATPSDPDGWTGRFYCGYTYDKEGCYVEVRQVNVIELTPEVERALDRDQATCSSVSVNGLRCEEQPGHGGRHVNRMLPGWRFW